jgi:CRISPR-associated protein Cmr6
MSPRSQASPTPREALATEIKRLGQHFKIEGKAEKAMKEMLAAVRGQ